MNDGCEMSIRLLTPRDIPRAQRLRALAGWNQTDSDWQHLLRIEPQGCFGAWIDGRLAGTATTTIYFDSSGNASLGWVGMVLVDPENRRKGVGSTLLRKCIAYLKERRVETIKLDATPQGKAVYDLLGFVDEYPLERWVGEAGSYAAGDSGAMAQTPLIDLAALTAYDTQYFGVDRREVLKAWLETWPACAAAAYNSSQRMTGYVLARRGSQFQQIGPLIADTPEIANILFRHVLEQLHGQALIVDVISENLWATKIVRRCGLRPQRPLIRMTLGANTCPGKPENILAICGPELG